MIYICKNNSIKPGTEIHFSSKRFLLTLVIIWLFIYQYYQAKFYFVQYFGLSSNSYKVAFESHVAHGAGSYFCSKRQLGVQVHHLGHDARVTQGLTLSPSLDTECYARRHHFYSLQYDLAGDLTSISQSQGEYSNHKSTELIELKFLQN